MRERDARWSVAPGPTARSWWPRSAGKPHSNPKGKPAPFAAARGSIHNKVASMHALSTPSALTAQADRPRRSPGSSPAPRTKQILHVHDGQRLVGELHESGTGKTCRVIAFEIDGETRREIGTFRTRAAAMRAISNTSERGEI